MYGGKPGCARRAFEKRYSPESHREPRTVRQSSFQYLGIFIFAALLFFMIVTGEGLGLVTGPMSTLAALCWTGAGVAGILAGRYAEIRVGSYVITWRQCAAAMWAGVGAVVSLAIYFALAGGPQSGFALITGFTLGLGAAACAVLFPLMTLRGGLGFQSDVDKVLDLSTSS